MRRFFSCGLEIPFVATDLISCQVLSYLFLPRGPCSPPDSKSHALYPCSRPLSHEPVPPFSLSPHQPTLQVDATGRPLLALPPADIRLRPVDLSADASAAFTAAYLEWLAAEDLQRISAGGHAEAGTAQRRRDADVLLRLAREACTAVGMPRRPLALATALQHSALLSQAADAADERARRRREEADEAEFSRSFLAPVDALIRRVGRGDTSAVVVSADIRGQAGGVFVSGQGAGAAIRAMGAEQALRLLMQPRAVVGSRRDLEAGLVRQGNTAAGNYNTGRRCASVCFAFIYSPSLVHVCRFCPGMLMCWFLLFRAVCCAFSAVSPSPTLRSTPLPLSTIKAPLLFQTDIRTHHIRRIRGIRAQVRRADRPGETRRGAIPRGLRGGRPRQRLGRAARPGAKTSLAVGG